MQPPDLPPFLDRRNQKGSTMTEPKAPKPRKTILRLVVEVSPPNAFALDNAQGLVNKARELGFTIRSARLTGIPTTTDLA